jgi:hypothetical protein
VLTETNAFLIPRFGGVAVQNLPRSSDGAAHENYELDAIKMKPLMEVYLSQLRSLLGVRESQIPHSSILFVSLLFNVISMINSHFLVKCKSRNIKSRWPSLTRLD